MLTHANLMANAVHTQLSQPLLPDDRYLTMAPMFHAAGVYTALVLPWVGATNVIVPGFDPDAVLDIIATDAITCAIAVPTMLAALVERQHADPRDMTGLRWLSHGASPVAVEVLRRAAALFCCELIHAYGATELSPLASVFRHEERLPRRTPSEELRPARDRRRTAHHRRRRPASPQRRLSARSSSAGRT